MTATVRDQLLRKLESLDQMPSLPVVVSQLLSYLEKPPDQLRISEVSNLIARDNSLAARCLHLANSPLFGRYQTVDTVHAAVIALGLRRMKEIAVSCCLLNLTPSSGPFDPVLFWEHSLECALLSRRVAQAIAFPHTEKAYLAGLLHDIGVIAHLWLAPNEFRTALDLATSRHISLQEAEFEILGITHCESGKFLAEKWHLGEELTTVIAFHHDIDRAPEHRMLTAIVSLADLLCRMNAMGYGFPEDRQVDLTAEPAFACLMSESPASKSVDWARITMEMDSYLEEVRRLVALLFRAK